MKLINLSLAVFSSVPSPSSVTSKETRLLGRLRSLRFKTRFLTSFEMTELGPGSQAGMKNAELKLINSTKIKSRGFTLLEALFSMVVIVIGLTAVMTLFQNGLSNLSSASTRMQAALIASNFFEELKSYGFNNLPAVPVSGNVTDMATANPGRISFFPAPFTGTIAMALVNQDLDGDGAGDFNNKAGASMLREYTLTVTAGPKFKAVTMRMRIAQ